MGMIGATEYIFNETCIHVGENLRGFFFGFFGFLLFGDSQLGSLSFTLLNNVIMYKIMGAWVFAREVSGN